MSAMIQGYLSLMLEAWACSWFLVGVEADETPLSPF